MKDTTNQSLFEQKEEQISPTRANVDGTHDPLKASKLLRIWYCLKIKGNNYFSGGGKSISNVSIDTFVLLKSIIAVFAVASIFSLVFFSYTSQLPRWFPSSNERGAALVSTPQKIVKVGCVSNNTKVFKQDTTDLSHIVFGIGGSASTWNTRRQYIELWWKPNVTRGYVWLDQEPSRSDPWPQTSPSYKVSSDTSKFKYTCSYGSRSAIRIARILKETFDLGLRNVRWFVLGDDDTVFLLENLVMVLNKYDHNQMYYIGGNSESVEQDIVHSYAMAYGGGGFAISYPLAKELVPILDGCIDRYHSLYGSDQKIQACIAELGVPLTKELGFHQVDIRGNPYGLLAAHPLAPLLSLHHLDYVDSIFPATNQIESLKKLLIPYNADPARTLQHSFCHDLTRKWSVSISWGYTIQLYPSLLTSKDLETKFETFQTWKSWANGPFTFDTRPSSQNACERPVLYFFDRVDGVRGSGGEVNETITTYTRHIDSDCGSPDYAPLLKVQVVNVSTPTLKPQFWKMAPRRQCCEVVESVNGVVCVKIRGCNPFESVTPP